MGNYGISKNLECSYEEAVEKVKAALSVEGFGVLTEIDVKATIEKKLDKDFGKYIILGACNPNYAYKALTLEQEIGLLMPCNVIVYENEKGKATVAAIDPVTSIGKVDNPAMPSLAVEVREKLEKVIKSLA